VEVAAKMSLVLLTTALLVSTRQRLPIVVIETKEEFGQDKSRPAMIGIDTAEGYFRKKGYHQLKEVKSDVKFIVFVSDGIFPLERIKSNIALLRTIGVGVQSDGTLAVEASNVALKPFEEYFGVEQGSRTVAAVTTMQTLTLTSGSSSIQVEFGKPLGKTAQAKLLSNPAKREEKTPSESKASADLSFTMPRIRDLQLSVFTEKYHPSSMRWLALAESAQLLEGEFKTFETARLNALTLLIEKLRAAGLAGNWDRAKLQTGINQQEPQLRDTLNGLIGKDTYGFTSESEADSFKGGAKLTGIQSQIVLQIALSGSTPENPRWAMFGIPYP